MLRIGIVANEPSGDILGAGLIRELRKLRDDIRFEGVAGPLMIAEGCRTLVPMERLSVMGLVEVVKHLPDLLATRRSLEKHFRQDPPDLFVGIDAPDFNIGLERRLRRAGIPTVHYVCPTVWAWRPKRVGKLREAADHVLCIFPFEEAFLADHGVPCSFVGHPLADEIPERTDRAAARRALGLDPTRMTLAVLPGSRVSEIDALAGCFLDAAQRCRADTDELQFVVPLVNERTRAAFEAIWRARAPDLPLTLVQSRSREALIASDLVLTASGTATLEALLLKRPMVVAYRLSPLTHWIVTRFRLVKTPFIAMANLLAGREIAREFVQQAATPEALAGALLELIHSPARRDAFAEEAERLHGAMRLDSSRKAALALLAVIEARK